MKRRRAARRSVIHRRVTSTSSSEAGQGIAYVLVLSAALLVFLIAFVDVLWNESKLLNQSRKSQELFHDLDAAADRAMYALLKEGNWDALAQGAVPGYQADVTYDDIQGVNYRLKVQEGNWTPYDPATDVEATWTPTGDVETERTITVWATRTPSGERRKLQIVVIKSSLSSALFSGGQIFVAGSADIYWGPAVSYATQSDAIPLATLGDHPIYLAAGGITVGGVAVGSLGKDSANPQASLSADEYSTTIGTAPVVPLDLLRQGAMEKEASTGEDFYKDALDTEPPFDLPASMGDDTVVFFETEDKAPWDGDLDSNVGNGIVTKKTGNKCGVGTLVVMGDLDVKGTGSCNRDMIPPPDCYPRFDATVGHCKNPWTENQIFWDGFIYVANELSGSGNVNVYGSIYARSTANLSGSLSIWYKTSNSSLGLLGKTVSVKLWRPRKPFSYINPSSGYIEAFPP